MPSCAEPASSILLRNKNSKLVIGHCVIGHSYDHYFFFPLAGVLNGDGAFSSRVHHDSSKPYKSKRVGMIHQFTSLGMPRSTVRTRERRESNVRMYPIILNVKR